MNTENTSEALISKRDYAVGDQCWIHIGGPGSNDLVGGKVVHVFTLPDWSFEQYVIEIPTEIDPLLEVRSALAMSEDAAGPILLFRNRPSTLPLATPRVRLVKVMAEHGVTGLWDSRGREMEASSLALSSELVARLHNWIRTYERSGFDLPRDSDIELDGPLETFVAAGREIAKATSAELPDWQVNYYAEREHRTTRISC